MNGLCAAAISAIDEVRAYFDNGRVCGDNKKNMI